MVQQQEKIRLKIGTTDVTRYFDIEKVLDFISKKDHTIRLKKGAVLQNENMQDHIYMIQKGMIKISTLQKRKEVTKYVLGPSEIVGIVPQIEANDSNQHIVSLEPTDLIQVHKDTFEDFVLDKVNWKMTVFSILQEQSQQLTDRIQSFVYKDSRTRIIEYLLEMNDHHGSRIGFEYVVRGFLKHQDIANITATSRQTVTTVLNELRDKELIKFDRKRLLIRDLEKLKAEIQ